VRPARALAVGAAAVALVVAGCGGDDEKADTQTTDTQTATHEATSPRTTTQPRTTATETTPTQTAETNGGSTSPEKQQGGAGDEVPNATQALITGRGGKLSPRQVSVPAFIAINLELRSADGLDYDLSGGGKHVHAGEGENSGKALFAGLRPDKSLRLSGPQGTVVISADAKPGP
jgi:hypothetical protein